MQYLSYIFLVLHFVLLTFSVNAQSSLLSKAELKKETLHSLESALATAKPEKVFKMLVQSRYSRYHQKQLVIPAEIKRCKNLQALRIETSLEDTLRLPPEIGELTNLQYLEVYGRGHLSIPKGIGKLINLKNLNIHNDLVASLPPEIGNLASLDTLVLGHNPFVLPEEITKLQRLKALILFKLEIGDKQLPKSLGNLKDLRYLAITVDNNAEFKELPASIGELTNLRVLQLQNAHLTTLPDEIKKLQNLEELSLVGLNSPPLVLPVSTVELNNLKSLKLTRVKSLPPNFSRLENLEELSLVMSSITELPEDFGNLPKLKKLLFNYTQLTSLPESFSHLENLEEFELQFSSITELPEDFGSLPKLKKLLFNYTSLTSLPESFGKLKRLSRFEMFNQVPLKPLPASFAKLNSLDSLVIKGHAMSVIPNEILALNNLRLLMLVKCQIEQIPSKFGNLKHLRFLALGDNQLNDASNLAVIEKLNSLQTLMLNDNNLQTFPRAFGENIQSIDLSDNKIAKLSEEDIAYFKSLNNLKKLSVRCNPFVEADDRLSVLLSLQQVKVEDDCSRGPNQLEPFLDIERREDD